MVSDAATLEQSTVETQPNVQDAAKRAEAKLQDAQVSHNPHIACPAGIWAGIWRFSIGCAHWDRMHTLCSIAHFALQDAAKRAEAKLQDAQVSAEQRSTELTRARAEVLQLRQELDECTQQLLLVARAQFHQQGGNGTAGGLSGDSNSDNVQEALAARLATTQVC
jgi:hypothetical protein